MKIEDLGNKIDKLSEAVMALVALQIQQVELKKPTVSKQDKPKASSSSVTRNHVINGTLMMIEDLQKGEAFKYSGGRSNKIYVVNKIGTNAIAFSKLNGQGSYTMPYGREVEFIENVAKATTKRKPKASKPKVVGTISLASLNSGDIFSFANGKAVYELILIEDNVASYCKVGGDVVFDAKDEVLVNLASKMAA
jgi:hypothetical protein